MPVNHTTGHVMLRSILHFYPQCHSEIRAGLFKNWLIFNPGLSENSISNSFFKKKWMILLEYSLNFQRIKLVNPKLAAQILPSKIGNMNTR